MSGVLPANIFGGALTPRRGCFLPGAALRVETWGYMYAITYIQIIIISADNPPMHTLNV